jgi:hypothetical protein
LAGIVGAEPPDFCAGPRVAIAVGKTLVMLERRLVAGYFVLLTMKDQNFLRNLRNI